MGHALDEAARAVDGAGDDLVAERRVAPAPEELRQLVVASHDLQLPGTIERGADVQAVVGERRGRCISIARIDRRVVRIERVTRPSADYTASDRAALQLLDDCGDNGQRIADDAEVGELEDRCIRILVDRDDVAGAAHADDVLRGAADADGD